MPPTNFAGRALELHALVRETLAHRLVTVVGGFGMGKVRRVGSGQVVAARRVRIGSPRSQPRGTVYDACHNWIAPFENDEIKQKKSNGQGSPRPPLNKKSRDPSPARVAVRRMSARRAKPSRRSRRRRRSTRSRGATSTARRGCAHAASARCGRTSATRCSRCVRALGWRDADDQPAARSPQPAPTVAPLRSSENTSPRAVRDDETALRFARNGSSVIDGWFDWCLSQGA